MAPRRRPASFWVAIVLGLLLLASCFLNVILAGAVALSQSDTKAFTEHHVVGEKTATDKVLDIALVGAISDVDAGRSLSIVHSIAAQLQQARKDEHIKAILLEVNSPGGGVTASDILFHELSEFKKERKVPIVVLCNDLAASGGYYASMSADHIMAHETSLVGSIGVIAEFTDIHGLMQKIGVHANIVKSRRADGSESYKDIGSPFREMKPAERALMQTMIQKMWTRFVDVIAIGRAGKMTRPQIEELADGRIWTGQQALELKLIDSLGYRNDAWKKAAELAGSPNAQLVTYRRPSSLVGDILGTRADAPDVNALLERALDPGAASPRMLYLWTGR